MGGDVLMSLRMDRTMFVHVPRTGGTWIRDVVDRLGMLRQQLRGDVDSHFTLGQLRPYWGFLVPIIVVRHPWTWVESRWSHADAIRARQNQRHHGVHRLFDLCCSDRFEKTIFNILEECPGIVTRTYWEMMGDRRQWFPSGIIRFDDLQRGLRDALTQNELMPGLSPELFWERCDEVVRSIPRNNSTSGEAREAGLLKCSKELRDRFLAAEINYMTQFNFTGDGLEN